MDSESTAATAQTQEVLLRGGVVVPMARNREWFRADLLVRGTKIESISQHPIEHSSENFIELDASNALVLPGFVQAHVHVVQSLLRHQADNLSLLDWLRRKTWPYEAALDGDGVESAAELGIAELVCGGTTTALDFGTTHNHDRVFEVADRLGIRFISGKTHMNTGEEVPEGLLEDADSSLAEAERLGQRWHGRAEGRLSYAVSPRFALSCTEQVLRASADLARRHGWLLQSHAAENREEIAAIEDLTGRRNIEYLADVGLVGTDVVLAHGIHLDPDEVETLAETRTRICHCPGANLKLGSGIANVPDLRRVGIPVALGADGAPCNNRLSIFHEMSLAATLHSLRFGPEAMDAWEVLAMATREGARALGLDDLVGTLEVGKRADIAVVSLQDWSALPAGDPASRLVYGSAANNVRHVLVDGRVIVEENSLQTASAEDLREKIVHSWEATSARMEEVA